jgi:hypothetical protein
MSSATVEQTNAIMKVARQEEAKIQEEEEEEQAAAKAKAAGAAVAAGTVEAASDDEEDDGEGADHFDVGDTLTSRIDTSSPSSYSPTASTNATASRDVATPASEMSEHYNEHFSNGYDQYFFQWEKTKGKKKSHIFRFKPSKGKLRLSPTASVVRPTTEEEVPSKKKPGCFMVSSRLQV